MSLVRLNIGAGDKYMPGFVNCDRHGEQDVACDAFPLPFDTDYADELWAIHLFEHIHRKDANDVLAEWYRVLKPGGLLVMEMPSLDKITNLLMAGEKNIRMTLLGLYGDPRDPRPDMLHHWCYSQAELTEMLTNTGLVNLAFSEPVFHFAKRDLRVTAQKPMVTA